MKTFFSLFSGVGGADCGARSAGLFPIGGVEIDPAIAAIHTANFGEGCMIADLLDLDLFAIPDHDFLWASPPCPNFSTAKRNGGEAQIDINLAQKISQILSLKLPKYFVLENVRGYANSESLKKYSIN